MVRPPKKNIGVEVILATTEAEVRLELEAVIVVVPLIPTGWNVNVPLLFPPAIVIEEGLIVPTDGVLLVKLAFTEVPPATAWDSTNVDPAKRPVSTVSTTFPDATVASKLAAPAPPGELIRKPDGAMVTVPIAGALIPVAVIV